MRQVRRGAERRREGKRKRGRDGEGRREVGGGRGREGGGRGGEEGEGEGGRGGEGGGVGEGGRAKKSDIEVGGAELPLSQRTEKKHVLCMH